MKKQNKRQNRKLNKNILNKNKKYKTFIVFKFYYKHLEKLFS